MQGIEKSSKWKKRNAKRRKKQEEYWVSRSGPVRTIKIEENNDS